MDRRRFSLVCASLAAAAPLVARAAAVAEADVARSAVPGDGSAGAGPGTDPGAPRSRLSFADGSPVTPAALAEDEAFVFGYPYVVTPAFLVRLGPGTLPDGSDGAPGGGMGGGTADASRVVAFSAICTHRMTHPSRPISHIGYRTSPIAWLDADGERVERAGLISCCSGRSLFDPAAGGRVLAGPAPAPLARIELEVSDGAVVAVGARDPGLHERFVDAFGFRLGLEHGIGDVRARSGDVVAIEPAARFSRQRVEC